jgi:hypothetical protein
MRRFAARSAPAVSAIEHPPVYQEDGHTGASPAALYRGTRRWSFYPRLPPLQSATPLPVAAGIEVEL